MLVVSIDYRVYLKRDKIMINDDKAQIWVEFLILENNEREQLKHKLKTNHENIICQ